MGSRQYTVPRGPSTGAAIRAKEPTFAPQSSTTSPAAEDRVKGPYTHAEASYRTVFLLCESSFCLGLDLLLLPPRRTRRCFLVLLPTTTRTLSQRDVALSKVYLVVLVGKGLRSSVRRADRKQLYVQALCPELLQLEVRRQLVA